MAMSIPAFHVSDMSKVEGRGEVFIASRVDAASAGAFSLKVAVHFDPMVDDYPIGTLLIKVDLSDSLKATFTSTSVELIDSYGKHNPTVYLTGRCTADTAAGATAVKGLRYWLLIANNRRANDEQGTPDIVGFAVHDRNGNRVAYGCGPLKSGDFTVAPK